MTYAIRRHDNILCEKCDKKLNVVPDTKSFGYIVSCRKCNFVAKVNKEIIDKPPKIKLLKLVE